MRVVGCIYAVVLPLVGNQIYRLLRENSEGTMSLCATETSCCCCCFTTGLLRLNCLSLGEKLRHRAIHQSFDSRAPRFVLLSANRRLLRLMIKYDIKTGRCLYPNFIKHNTARLIGAVRWLERAQKESHQRRGESDMWYDIQHWIQQ